MSRRVAALVVEEPAMSSSWRKRGITNLTVQTPTSSRSEQAETHLSPPRWGTKEFICYGIVFVIALPIMFYIPIALSQPSHPNYHIFEHKLSPGWIFGRKVDNSDSQYRTFRSNITALFALSTVSLVLSKIYSHYFRPLRKDNLSRIPFLAALSLCMTAGLHGTSIIKILVILGMNYLIADRCHASHLGPVLTWLFNLAVMFSNEVNSGYRFAAIHPSLGPLDSVQGFHPRWHIGFNITVLRLIAFNMDYYWACRRAGTEDTGFPLNEKLRVSTRHDLASYNFLNFVAYTLYPPLYIAGPIMTFNDFMWQIRRPVIIRSREVFFYLFRFLACLATMEFILHFMYVVAIKDTSAWQGNSPGQLSMIGFWNLIIVWLKLLIPWRFFRLWALADGIDPPENMVRCMANNYSPLGFWRSWHRSYNIWIKRYIYIPLGGAQTNPFSTLIVFTFVALWHDLSLRLLTWGWLVTLFVMPEMIAGYLFTSSRYGNRSWYRHVCAIGGVVNVLMMMIANLVGFVLGIGGMEYLANQLFGTWEGIGFLLVALPCIFVAVQVMFEYREEEKRRSIYRKY